MAEVSHIGERKRNNKGTLMEITAFNSKNDIRVRFLDEHGVEVNATYCNFKRGCIKNPYDISVYGVGYVGVGPYRTKIDGHQTTEYIIWVGILQRCYSKKWSYKYPSYYGKCEVADEWLNFQNFAAWYNRYFYNVPKRLHVDKDILVMGNRIYAPDKCLLVPQRINMLFMSRRTDDEYIKHIESVVNEYKNIMPAYVASAISDRIEHMKEQN